MTSLRTARRTSTRRAFVLGAGTLATVSLAACGKDEDSADGGGADGGGADGGSSDGSGSGGGTASDGGAAGGRDIDRTVPYLELASGSDGPVVDLLLDFRCPPCRYFMQEYGDYFDELVENEKAVLRIHPRPMLDGPRGTTFSQDTAAAAAAVYAQDPALLMPFEHAMYAAQPESAEEPDPTLEEIVEIAREIGADDTAIGQIEERVYVDWTLEVVEPDAAALEVGTPTVLIDGEIWQGDWTQPGSLQDAIGV